VIGLRNNLTSGISFLGDIDEVRIFNRILTATEILNIYNAEKPFHY